MSPTSYRAAPPRDIMNVHLVNKNFLYGLTGTVNKNFQKFFITGYFFLFFNKYKEIQRDKSAVPNGSTDSSKVNAAV